MRLVYFWLKISSAILDYITYEGLRRYLLGIKFIIYIEIIYIHKIRITLPMRDWDCCICFFKLKMNWRDYITYEGLRRVNTTSSYHIWRWSGLHYLWGIETLWTWLLDTKIDRRITLPMRDWDLFPEKIFTILLGRITLPMRDWDLTLNLLINLYVSWITLPMRDWDAFVIP